MDYDIQDRLKITFNSLNDRFDNDIKKHTRIEPWEIEPVALDILNQYKTAISQPSDFVFPIIEDAELFDANEEYQAHLINANILCGQKLRR